MPKLNIDTISARKALVKLSFEKHTAHCKKFCAQVLGKYFYLVSFSKLCDLFDLSKIPCLSSILTEYWLRKLLKVSLEKTLLTTKSLVLKWCANICSGQLL